MSAVARHPGDARPRNEHTAGARGRHVGDPREEGGRAPAWPVDPTGVPGLDEVLGGGVQRGALVLVAGPPGSGKTMLVAQMAFAAAAAGRQSLILTAFSEPASALIGHLRTYRFFDERLLGGPVEVHALEQYLDQGLEAAAQAVAADVRRLRASLVLLDGFGGVRGVASEAEEARRFLYDLGARLGLQGATTIITSEATPRQSGLFAEATSADVLLGMHYTLEGVRGRRAIEAIKVRGAAPLVGLHSLTLGAGGAAVYPRLEARVTAAESATGDTDEGDGRDEGPPAAFELPALDALLGGGLTTGTPGLLLGGPGLGKTLLAQQFALAGLRIGEPAVILGFHETGREMLRKAAPFAAGGLLRAALAPGGGLTLLRVAPVERDADVLADLLLAAVDRAEARRVVIDSVGELERAVRETSDAGRVPGFFAALLEALRARGATTLLIRETGVVVSDGLRLEADMASLQSASVIWLQQISRGGRLRRMLSVPKMRFSAHDLALREYTIAPPDGLQVLGPLNGEGD